MFDPKQHLLGRLPSQHHPRTLRLSRYLTAPLPPPPPTKMHHVGIDHWAMMANNEYGNCLIVPD
jgi:hypothetical protein